MAIAFDNFVRFLDANAAHEYKCTFCGSRSFGVNSGRTVPGLSNAAVGVTLPFVDPRPNVEGGVHEFYSIACRKCGRADFFHINQINDWLAKNPELPPDDPETKT
jgi:ribosomal protein L37E